jgi:fused signal recognition particle receptor
MPCVADNNWRQALQKTRRSTFGRIAQLLGTSEINQDFWEDLETVLIQADVGLTMTEKLLAELSQQVREHGYTRGEQARRVLTELLLAYLPAHELPVAAIPTRVSILVGVNGSGKTTSAAKLANLYQQAGKKVLLVAADTYRAAATEQLSKWGEQLGIEVVAGKSGGDPGAIVYEACEKALAAGLDEVVVDTSGRMHTEHNLMAELQKICRVSGKVIEDAPHSVLLVLDATTGQNGIVQARAFTSTVEIDGVILAKLDGSAKGGIALAIQSELAIPVLFAGLGEGIKDLVPFSREAYIESLLAVDVGTVEDNAGV